MYVCIAQCCRWLLTNAAGSDKAMRQEYGAALKKQIQMQQVLKSQRGKA